MEISIESRQLGDVCVLAPQVFQDDRGFFTEVFRADQFKARVCRLNLSRTTIPARCAACFADCIFSGTLRWENSCG